MNKKKVFIVHGHDEKAKAEAESLIFRLGMEPIVLHRQPNVGRYLFEKFEQESDVEFAIVLLTPDDVGKAVNGKETKYRARQNVVFEMGFFFAKLGRKKVYCLVKGDIEKPSDVEGIVYMSFQSSVEELENELKQEFEAAKPKIPTFLGLPGEVPSAKDLRVGDLNLPKGITDGPPFTKAFPELKPKKD